MLTSVLSHIPPWLLQHKHTNMQYDSSSKYTTAPHKSYRDSDDYKTEDKEQYPKSKGGSGDYTKSDANYKKQPSYKKSDDYSSSSEEKDYGSDDKDYFGNKEQDPSNDYFNEPKVRVFVMRVSLYCSVGCWTLTTS